MLEVVESNKFKKDVERAIKQGLDISLLKEVILKLARQEKLEAKYKDHALKGNLSGLRECHIKPDWLLLYTVDDKELELFLFRTGTHSEVL